MNPCDSIHVVLLPTAIDAPVIRLAVAGDGRVLARDTLPPGTPQAAAGQPPGRTVVVVPGTEAPVRWLTLPAFSHVQARAAALAMARDELAAAGPTHVAVGAAADPQVPRPVAAVAEATMDAWLARVEALGLRADAIVPDHLALPAPADETGAVVVARDGDWLVRTASGAFRVEAELAATVLGAAAPAPLTGAGAVESLLARGALEAPLDLLQGPYAATDERPTGPRAWRRAAVLAAVLAASVPLLWVVEAGGHLLAARSLQADIAARTAQALPGAGEDPVHGVRAAVARVRAREDFPRAFAALSGGVQQLDGAAIDSVSWQAGAPLRAVVIHDAAAQLESLASHVGGHGMALVTVGTQRADGRLHSEIDLVEESR